MFSLQGSYGQQSEQLNRNASRNWLAFRHRQPADSAKTASRGGILTYQRDEIPEGFARPEKGVLYCMFRKTIELVRTSSVPHSIARPIADSLQSEVDCPLVHRVVGAVLLVRGP
jgi:hypothetical protein